MFTAEEKPLLTGTDEEIEEFVDWERCVIVDWRGSEDETIDEVIRFLPDGALTYETTFPGTDTVSIRMRFRSREHLATFPFQPQNNFRVLLDLWRLLQPDYDIKLFRCTDGSDTNGFLLRPIEWWTTYRAAYPRQYQRVFRDVADLTELWELDAPAKSSSAKTKSWWRFW